MWPLGLTAATIVGWASLDYLQVNPIRLWPLVLAIGQGTLLLYLMGRWAGPPTRVIAYAAIVGGFACLPILISLLLPAFILIYGEQRSLVAVAAKLAWVPLLLFWVVLNVRQVQRRAVDSKILVNAYAVTRERVVFDRVGATPLASADRLEYVSAFLFVLVAPMLYLAPRLADAYGSPRATLLQVATFATPLAIHLLGHFARAAYLWLYLPWKLEKKHGKPVHLNHSTITNETDYGH
jgi:hypothetical protein